MNLLLSTAAADTATNDSGVWDRFIGTVTEWATNAGIKILISVLIIFIGFRVINFLSRRIMKKALAKKADKTIVKTLAYVLGLTLKIALVIALMGYVGIETSSFAAIFASLSVCVGLAVNGALANIAGGVLIILTRPFKIDDYIKVGDYEGTVEDIHLVHTKMRTFDNRVIYIPNGTLSSSTVENYSAKDLRRVDLTFSVSYNTDVEFAKKVILEAVSAHSRVLNDPAPFVRVSSLSSSSIDIAAKVWVINDDYWTVYFDTIEAVRAALVKNGIEIPYHKLDVNIRGGVLSADDKKETEDK